MIKTFLTFIGGINWRKTLAMAALILAGEAVFLQPFVVARIFRPTFLDVFGITNLELGTAFSVYGVIAMFAYFLGGPLADRFPARRLIATALVTTALGGVMFATIPSLAVLTILYGFWGLTTILLFWAALIRATREWGGTDGQGKAFGILDSGRGLFAALLSSLSVLIFASFLPETVESASLEERKIALGAIIWIFSGIGIVAAGLIWILIPEPKVVPGQVIEKKPKITLDGLKAVGKLPTVWLQALIILCAYVGYKCTDDFSLYASDAFGYDDVAAAKIGTISFWVRPFAAMGAGLLGDRIGASRVLIGSFALLILGSLVIALGGVVPGILWMLFVTIAGTSAGIYALRGLYFAIFEDANVPLVFTGSAVGLVSVIGYTPDIFMGPLMGYLIDRSPGAVGHQQVFGVLALFGAIGLVATVLFSRYSQKTSLG